MMIPEEIVKRVAGLNSKAEGFAQAALEEVEGDVLDAASILIWAASLVLVRGDEDQRSANAPRGYDIASDECQQMLKEISEIVKRGPKYVSLLLLIMSTRIFFLNDVELKSAEEGPRGTA